MECESGRQGLEHHRILPIHYIVSIVLLFSGLVSVESPSLIWSAVYECLDVWAAAGFKDTELGV
jgi:hypothetical protein